VSDVRELQVHEIAAAVKTMCITANYDLPQDVYDALLRAQQAEASPTGREILGQLVENADIAAADRVPICQDTGFAVFFAEVGQDVHLVGGSFADAVNEGVREGYADGCLRKSIAAQPAQARRNTTDNTPAIIHTTLVPGDKVRLWMMAKGGGAENMSSLNMLKPSQGWAGMSQAVVDTVSRAGANPCPPVIVGVGIGGTFEKCAMLAKHSLLRRIGSTHADPFYAKMEGELLERINRLGIGPQGLGGRVTALAVFIEAFPCHIATMPCAVNINCHAARHQSITF
jgi:fumarate hydratase subunit alpha